MNGFDIYRNYVALKSHFTTKYDFFEYGGRTSVTHKSYNKRNDQFFFEKLADKLRDEEVVPYLVSNIVEGEQWIGNFELDGSAHSNYRMWQGRMNALDYHYTSTLENMLDFCTENNVMFNDLFKCTASEEVYMHPIIFKFYLQKIISAEFFVILDLVLGFIKNIDAVIGDDYTWGRASLFFRKYAKFLPVSSAKYSTDTMNVLQKYKHLS